MCLNQKKIELAEQIYKRGIRIYEDILKNEPESHVAAVFLSYTYDSTSEACIRTLEILRRLSSTTKKG
jgi:hypothetical protein